MNDNMDTDTDFRRQRREELNGFQTRLLAELTEVVSERRRAAGTTPAANRSRPARRAHRAAGGRRLPIQVVALGLAVLAGIGAVQLADVGPEPVRVGQGSVAAAEVLRDLAAVTERQPATKPGPVRYARTLERPLVRLADLPTDPAALAKVIRTSQAGRRYADNTQDAPIEHKMWAWLKEALWHPDASPKLQAAMLRVAAGLKGVDVQGGVADLTGRVGDAITFTFVNEAMFRATMIVDPAPGRSSAGPTLVDPRGRGWLKDHPIGEDATTVYLASGSVTSLRQAP